jgi:hypothetical protein
MFCIPVMRHKLILNFSVFTAKLTLPEARIVKYYIRSSHRLLRNYVRSTNCYRKILHVTHQAITVLKIKAYFMK